jgi:chemotaxis protein methyltransferase CheR
MMHAIIPTDPVSPVTSPVWSDPAIESVIELVTQRTGLTFSASRRKAVEQQLRVARSAAGVGDWVTYRRLLSRDAEAFDLLAGSLTVDESYFFRDRSQFQLLREKCIPQLAAQTGRLQIWSAGCAGGQEPYSLAILCEQAGIADRTSITGTDLSSRRLQAAMRGRYSRWSLRGVTDDVIARYFDPVDVQLQLKPSIRRAVEFRQLNLADPLAWQTAPRGVDLLLCRNVLIYLQPDAIALAARELIASLSDRGRLLLGASDPPIADYTACHVEVTEAGLVYARQAPRALRAHERPAREPEKARPRPAPPVTAMPAEAAPDQALPAAAATTVRSLADHGQLHGALDACLTAIQTDQPSTELHYLYSTLLSQEGRHAEAAAAARRALYLDRSLALGHAALGVSLARIGDRAGALRSLRVARQLLSAMSDDDPVACAGGETAARVRAAVIGCLETIGDA